MVIAVLLGTALLCAVVWGVALYLSELPTHNDSKRYHEYWMRPGTEHFQFRCSFRYKRSAMKWVLRNPLHKGHTKVVDTKTERVLYCDA